MSDRDGEIEMAMQVGKAQAVVLEALGLSAWDNQDAERIFGVLGLRVIGKRVGRTSEPEVTVSDRMERVDPRLDPEGDAQHLAWAKYPLFDMTAILPYVTNRDEAEAMSQTARQSGASIPTIDAIREQMAREDAERRQQEREWKRRMGF